MWKAGLDFINCKPSFPINKKEELITMFYLEKVYAIAEVTVLLQLLQMKKPRGNAPLYSLSGTCHFSHA